MSDVRFKIIPRDTEILSLIEEDINPERISLISFDYFGPFCE
jgi:hypothetical protein